ncbi:inactive purple acid phosphatase-like protein [Thalictrum thalictroides]|uniref:Inactive purple acid phosphatase-like protein n=1 Tax=Thalictrum thalictroides TaxID=46969 RepID=A0A7J6WMS8_THATH|nr:inactive purple acid phosphatase-like protein [Thalictrum thalictroides]
MAASSSGFATPPSSSFPLKLKRFGVSVIGFRNKKCRLRSNGDKDRLIQLTCSCSSKSFPGFGIEISEQWRLKSMEKKSITQLRALPASSSSFASPRSHGASKPEKFYPRCTPRNSGPQSRDTPPKRDTGIANEKDWGINMSNGYSDDSGTNEDGSTWYRESGEDHGENGYRCRWTRMGGQSGDGSSEWKEMWWEKSDWTGYKELGVEKSGKNAEGDSWWETWKEVLHQDEWRTDKWAETQLGTKWGDKWEEKFYAGIGSRQGETWHVSPPGDRWSRTWGEEHFGNGKVHKYGKSTTGEIWDIVVDEETYYEAEPHYGWADVVGDSSQLLSIKPRKRPPGVYPNLDFGPFPPPRDDKPPNFPPL